MADLPMCVHKQSWVGWGWDGLREAQLGMSLFYFWSHPHLLLSSLVICLQLFLPPAPHQRGISAYP